MEQEKFNPAAASGIASKILLIVELMRRLHVRGLGEYITVSGSLGAKMPWRKYCLFSRRVWLNHSLPSA